MLVNYQATRHHIPEDITVHYRFGLRIDDWWQIIDVYEKNQKAWY
jgi:hypothetical protein